MNENIKSKEKVNKVTIIVSRTFGSHNLLEVYADYVAKKIKDILRKERGKKDEENS